MTTKQAASHRQGCGCLEATDLSLVHSVRRGVAGGVQSCRAVPNEYCDLSALGRGVRLVRHRVGGVCGCLVGRVVGVERLGQHLGDGRLDELDDDPVGDLEGVALVVGVDDRGDDAGAWS